VRPRAAPHQRLHGERRPRRIGVVDLFAIALPALLTTLVLQDAAAGSLDFFRAAEVGLGRHRSRVKTTREPQGTFAAVAQRGELWLDCSTGSAAHLFSAVEVHGVLAGYVPDPLAVAPNAHEDAATLFQASQAAHFSFVCKFVTNADTRTLQKTCRSNLRFEDS
jgi:hypothetical protein